MHYRHIVYATLLDRDRRYCRENGHFMSTSASIRSYAILWTVSSAKSFPALPRRRAVSFAALLSIK
jgi:hypothetical protein